MGKWEYKVVDSREVEGQGFFGGTRSDEVEEYLNRLGLKVGRSSTWISMNTKEEVHLLAWRKDQLIKKRDELV